MERPREVVRAEKLRFVQSRPEYQDTVGLWLKEAYDTALLNLESATEPHEVHRAQGAYKALKELIEFQERVFAAEEAAIKRLHKKFTITKGPTDE